MTDYDAEEYENALFYAPGEYQDWLLRTVGRVFDVPSTGKLLDVGAGTGHFTALLADRLGLPLGQVLCVESQASMAEQAAKRGMQVRTESLEDLARRGEQDLYDAALLKEVIHLVDLEALAPLQRSLKRGSGKILVVTRPPVAGHPFGASGVQSYAEVTPAVDTTLTALRAAGFRDVVAQEFDFPCTIETEKWCSMLRTRFWSNLQKLSDKQLDEDIAEIRKKHGDRIEFRDSLLFITAVAGPAEQLGAFRDQPAAPIDLAPELLATLRSSDWRRPGESPQQAFDLEQGHHLNHAAFGAAFGAVRRCEQQLRQVCEENPNRFYDEVCLPLLRETLAVARDVFQCRDGADCVLMPNATMAVKGCLEAALAAGGRCAFLPPIYGATRKLLTLHGTQEIPVPSLLQENPSLLVRALDEAFLARPFQVLAMDHVTSQSGRVLPLRQVIAWCRAHDVLSIVDGTQSYSFGPDWPDYYLLSTHKWLGNIKTCGIVRVAPQAPSPKPCAVSFGFPDQPHAWSGMLDYIPFITLQKCLRIFQAHGDDLRARASAALDAGLEKVGARVLPRKPGRLFDLVRVWRPEADLQASLARAGVFVSVKQLDAKQLDAPAGSGSVTCLRVSAFAYSQPDDFAALGDFLQYNHRLLGYAGLRSESGSDEPGGREQRAEQAKRAELIDSFHTTFDLTDSLMGQMSNEAFFTRAEPLRHPLIFYFGHTAVFFVNKLCLGTYLPIEDRIDPELESLCAVGVDEMSWDDLQLGNWDKVPAAERAEQVFRVRRYRQRVKQLVTQLAEDEARTLLRLPITKDDFWYVLLMGIEHERIHVETSSVIMARIPPQLLRPSSLWPICPDGAKRLQDAPENQLVRVPAGTTVIGQPWDEAPYYGWDNEFGAPQRVSLEAFQVSQHLVSNAEYWRFVQDRGYEREECWSAFGWQWCRTEGTKRMPLFWIGVEPEQIVGASPEQLRLRTLTREVPMPWDWPVETNNYEAEAFCIWKGLQLQQPVRLLAHPEWHLLRGRATQADYNVNLRRWASGCPVDRFGEPLGAEGEMIFDVTGNAWQHSVSPLTVLPDFAPHQLYDDFTLPTIDGEHNFILGGSWASLGNCARHAARYGFRRHFYQFAGIRYCVSPNPHEAKPAKVLEAAVGGVLSEHFLDFEDPVPLEVPPVKNIQVELAEAAAQCLLPQSEASSDGSWNAPREASSDGSWTRASTELPARAPEARPVSEARVLMLQGGPGRATCELLARVQVGKLVHSDPTANHLDALVALRRDRCVRWDRVLEGHIYQTETFPLPDAWAEPLAAQDLDVVQVNAWNLRAESERWAEGLPREFDLVVLDLPQLGRASWDKRNDIPRDLDAVVAPGGRLVLLKPSPLESLPGFVSESRRRVAHIARDTRRKHQYSVSELSVWRRTADAVSTQLPDRPTEEAAEFYARPTVLAAYDAFHFGPGVLGVKNFAQRCAEICLDVCKQNGTPLHAALDCGCGPGRLALDLAAEFEHVAGFDFAPDFVDMLAQRAPKNLTCFVADACKIDEYPETQRKFDLIVGGNLIDRLPDPDAWIQRSKGLLSDRGMLVVLSPFTWMEQWTPVSKWLGGVRKDSEICWTMHGLVKACLPELVLARHPSHVPFTLPEADQTFQYTTSQLLVFRRRVDGDRSADLLNDRSAMCTSNLSTNS